MLKKGLNKYQRHNYEMADSPSRYAFDAGRYVRFSDKYTENKIMNKYKVTKEGQE